MAPGEYPWAMQQAAMLALLVTSAAGAALLLRQARCPGWPVVGGVAAGLVLGPSILGRALPSFHERVFLGGAAERAVLREVDRRHAAELAAAATAPGGAAEAAGRADAMRRRQATERSDAEAAWLAALHEHAVPRRLACAALAATVLLGAAAAALPRAGARGSLVAPLSIGLWAAALPGGLAYFALRLWGDVEPASAALAAAAAAFGPWALTAVDRDAAERAEVGGASMVQAAGRVASAAAIVTATAALASRGGASAWWALALLGAPLGWLIPPPHPGTARLATGALRVVLVPALGAAAALDVNLFATLDARGPWAVLWPILLFLLLSGDARWLGAFTGAIVLGGRGGLRTMRLVMGAMAAGPTQLAATAVAAGAGGLGGDIVLALLLGAVLVEVTTPARRAMARRLRETEQEMEDLNRSAGG